MSASEEQQQVVATTSVSSNRILDAVRRSQYQQAPDNRISTPSNPFLAAIQPQTMCAAHPRTAIAPPPWTGINAAMATLTVVFADLTDGTTCPYTPDTPTTNLGTAQMIAPYLALTAAHVMSTVTVKEPNCANVKLVAVYCA